MNHQRVRPGPFHLYTVRYAWGIRIFGYEYGHGALPRLGCSHFWIRVYGHAALPQQYPSQDHNIINKRGQRKLNIMATYKPDFSKEDLKATPVEIADGAWLLGEAHNPAGMLNQTVNNRAFVYKLKLKEDLAGVKAGKDVLFVFGLGMSGVIASVKKLEKETGCKAVAMMCNGAGHHIALEHWYEAFPDMAIWVCPTKVPGTVNGKELIRKYADRWELVDNTTTPHHAHQLLKYFGSGDDLQVDCIIFNQLFFYSDETSCSIGMLENAHSKPKLFSNGFVFKDMGKLMGDHST
jgi:hypothetical protein